MGLWVPAEPVMPFSPPTFPLVIVVLTLAAVAFLVWYFWASTRLLD